MQWVSLYRRENQFESLQLYGSQTSVYFNIFSEAKSKHQPQDHKSIEDNLPIWAQVWSYMMCTTIMLGSQDTRKGVNYEYPATETCSVCCKGGMYKEHLSHTNMPNACSFN